MSPLVGGAYLLQFASWQYTTFQIKRCLPYLSFVCACTTQRNKTRQKTSHFTAMACHLLHKWFGCCCCASLSFSSFSFLQKSNKCHVNHLIHLPRYFSVFIFRYPPTYLQLDCPIDIIYDTTWHDMTWHERTRHDTIWHDITRHNTKRHKNSIYNFFKYFKKYFLKIQILHQWYV